MTKFLTVVFLISASVFSTFSLADDPSFGCRTGGAGAWALTLDKDIYNAGEFTLNYGQDNSWDYSKLTPVAAGNETNEKVSVQFSKDKKTCLVNVSGSLYHYSIRFSTSDAKHGSLILPVGSMSVLSGAVCSANDRTFYDLCNPIKAEAEHAHSGLSPIPDAQQATH